MKKNYLKAKDISDAFASKVEFNSDDFSNMALAYAQLGFFKQSIEYYNKSLELNPENIYSLNNKAYTLILLERYPESIEL